MPHGTAARRRVGLKAMAVALLALSGSFEAGQAVAADLSLRSSEARPVKSAVSVDVYSRRARHRHWGCSDRYSCFALYGAYGPYGGPSYWGAYTAWYR